jgi:hypothetical protein
MTKNDVNRINEGTLITDLTDRLKLSKFEDKQELHSSRI